MPPLQHTHTHAHRGAREGGWGYLIVLPLKLQLQEVLSLCGLPHGGLLEGIPLVRKGVLVLTLHLYRLQATVRRGRGTPVGSAPC